MKTTIYKKGDKNFEKEKAKMFEPGLTKEDQLRLVFTSIIDKSFYTNYHGIKTNYPHNNGVYIEDVVKLLLYEVKIRTKL